MLPEILLVNTNRSSIPPAVNVCLIPMAAERRDTHDHRGARSHGRSLFGT
jgi:hypothetical protein